MFNRSPPQPAATSWCGHCAGRPGTSSAGFSPPVSQDLDVQLAHRLLIDVREAGAQAGRQVGQIDRNRRFVVVVLSRVQDLLGRGRRRLESLVDCVVAAQSPARRT